ncbi:MAG: hypothetical protein WC635_06390 [Bacteriovorax sp.]
MRAIAFLYMLLTSAHAQDWTKISACGEYQVRGVARSIKNSLVIVVNEKSRSEIIVKVPVRNEAYLAPYLDKPMEALVLFAKKAAGAEVNGKIKEVKPRLPNPINPMDTGIKFISKVACE